MFSQSPRRFARTNGFTLLEIMIAVAIIGILTAIALPNYTDYLLRSRLVDAASNLSALRVKLEQTYQDNRAYGLPSLDANACPTGSAAATSVTALNAAQPLYWVYNCGVATDGNNGQSYQALATGQGSLSGFVFKIDQSNNRQTTVTGAAATKGYASSTTCWVRKKPAQC